MSDAIRILLQEHRNISKVLELVNGQVANMAARAPVNFRLLEGCFEYLSSYPETCHHPKEDLVYRKVCSRAPDIVESLRDLVDEHGTLARFTRSLRRSIAVAGDQLPLVNSQLVDELTTYLDEYRLHMASEEEYFFSAGTDAAQSRRYCRNRFHVIRPAGSSIRPRSRGKACRAASGACAKGCHGRLERRPPSRGRVARRAAGHRHVQ